MSASTREPEQSEEHQQRTRALEERFTHSGWYKRQQMILDLGRRTFLPADWCQVRQDREQRSAICLVLQEGDRRGTCKVLRGSKAPL